MVAGKQILIVEDERDIADLLLLHLADLNVDTTVCTDGLQGWHQLTAKRWDLAILDLRLPGMDGLEICRRLRLAGHTVPVLMLTAKSSELDRVLGLEVGADDYVTKPFSILEVMARVRALLRRVEMSEGLPEAPRTLDFGALRIDEASRDVRCLGRQVELTPREFALLVYFASHPGRVFTRSQLYDAVWGYGHDGYEHTVNSHINRLRSKLSSVHREDYILTVWGVGYKFNDKLSASDVA